MTLFRSGITVAFFTLISRIFGLVRELFVASIFGSTNMADSVNVAFKLPNLFRRIFGEGALSAVFVPIFNEKMLISKSEARHFTGSVFTILLLTLIILVILMQIFMPSLMFIIAPGFHENKAKFDLTVLLCRITMPYLVFISITAMFGGILNSVKSFAAFAFSPVILSVSIIIGTLILKEKEGAAISVSVALLVAGILQILFMLICVIKEGLFFPLVFNPFDKSVKKFLINMAPASISSGVQQLNLFISQSIASFIEGAISILSYADRIYQFPLSLIGATFGTILLPELSRTYKLNDFKAASVIQNNAIKIGLLLSLPASFGIIILSHPIIHIIYERGVFTPDDTIKTAETISAFAMGLPAFILAKILTPIFYANHDTRTPLKITLYSLIANSLLNIILMMPFKHIGIALGSSIAGWGNVVLLYYYAKKVGKFHLSPEVKLYFAKVLISCLIMSGAIYTIKYYYHHHFYSEFTLVKIGILGGTISIGAILYFGSGLYFKLYSMKDKK